MKILNISNLSKIYNNKKQALSNIDLSIYKGEFVALLGHNGAGKSTLINVLATSVIKSSGSVEVNGFDIDKDRNDFKKSIGIIPQEVNFNPLFTPMEILGFQQGMYGLPYNKKQIEDLLINMDLIEKANTPSRQLSGGMKRRLLIAKALVHDPEVIILDEPTAGVDVELRQQLWEYLKKLNNLNKTIILTTHYLEEAEYLCNRVVIIDSGKLIIDQPKDQLIKSIGSKQLVVFLKNSADLILFKNKYASCIIDNNTVKIPYKEVEELFEAINYVSTNNIDTLDIQIHSPKLEDIFLKSKSI
jgi:ABC-2 type transport system ATP-binding protein